jgi:5-methylcytosine-specific restriction endonuclease McrA
MSYSHARTRYKSIKKRSFETFLDLFLVSTYIDDKSLHNANEEKFSAFGYSDERIPKALTAYQLGNFSAEFDGRPVSDLDNVVDSWYESHDLSPYKLLFQNKIIPEDDFYEFYKSDDFDRECNFCSIKESEIDKLILSKKINTKRLGTRGKKMEIERLKPNEGYVKDNIALCCYWCNNAKTDEFTAEEFRPIGKLIGQTLKNRLNK